MPPRFFFCIDYYSLFFINSIPSTAWAHMEISVIIVNVVFDEVEQREVLVNCSAMNDVIIADGALFQKAVKWLKSSLSVRKMYELSHSDSSSGLS